MTKTVRYRNRIRLLTAFLLFCFWLSGDALANSEENIGFFENGKLQEMIQRPFHLYHINKETAIPFYAKDYIEWKYSVVEDYGHVSEIENPFLCSIKEEVSIFCNLTKTFDKRIHNRKNIQVFLKGDEMKEYLASLSKEIDSEPENGKVEIDDDGNLYFTDKGKMGHRINIEESYSKIVDVLKNESSDYYIPLTTNEIRPLLSEESIDKIGIREKIGSGESNFRGSTENRKHNIRVASDRFNGLLIKPGEEFSFIENLGEVDGEHGYKKELVIKKNTTVPEFGGGVCQVSTTTFRAALNTGLEITERHNHAYPVSYYNPPGSDATVYIPKPDLSFINNTNNYILIQTRIEGTKLFFDFYGTSDGRQVEIDGPTITERTSEGKIRTILYQIVKDKNGEEIRKDVFKSFYDNHDNYPNPNEILRSKPKDWSGKQWDEYYAKYGSIIEQLNSQGL